MRIYVDTNVFVACVRSEINGAFNLRGADSARFFAACGSQGAEIVLSELFFQEAERVVSLHAQHVLDFLAQYRLSPKCVPIAPRERIAEVMHQTGIHRADSTHVATAVEQGCRLVVTWNVRDFRKAAAWIACCSPLDFLEPAQPVRPAPRV